MILTGLSRVLSRARVGCACAAVLASVAVAAAAADTPPARPNVILFLVDDMGWMDSTPYGSQYYDTPNMDRLSRQAMRFTDAYACPLCSPTRACLMTGKYSARHGITTASGHQPPQPAGFQFLPDTAAPNRPIVSPVSKNYLDLSEITLAEVLRGAGYRTAHLGKWHLGQTVEYRPPAHGFDESFHSAPDPGPPSYFSPYGVVPEGRPSGQNHVGNITDGPPGEYITDRLTDEALKFIEANRERPFFLNLWQFGVHGPWGHKESYTREYANRSDPRGLQGNPIMASMLKSVDDSLGRVLDKLEELKLADNTLLIFFSDNGGNVHSNKPDDRKSAGKESGPRGEQLRDWRKWAGDQPPTNNTPLRSGKGTLYEGGCRVPLMVRWPGVVPAGTANDTVVGAIDVYPTVLELSGVPKPSEQVIDGVSLAPVLKQQGKLDRTAYFNYFPHGGPNKPGGVWVRQGDWKLIRWFETGPDYPSLHELYNLRDDLGEARNLAAAQPDRVRELNALIDHFLADTHALAPKPNPAYKPTEASAATGKAARPLEGWVPKSSTAEIRDGALVVTGDGRAPFLGMTNLKHAGPVKLRLRSRGPGGAGKVQWRTADQETFPTDGQIAEFSLTAGEDWREVTVDLPVKGTLHHLRLYLPAQSAAVELDWIELQPAAGKPQRWEFDGK